MINKTMMQVSNEIIMDYCAFYDYILKNKIQKNFNDFSVKSTELYHEIISIFHGIEMLKKEINNVKKQIKEKNKNLCNEFLNLNLINNQIEKLFSFCALNNGVILKNLQLLKNIVSFFNEIYKLLSLSWDNFYESLLTDDDKKQKFSVLFS